MSITLLAETVLSSLGHLHHTPSGWHTRNCPVCIRRGFTADTRGRFGVMHDSSKFLAHCFNCKLSVSYSDGGSLTDKMKAFMVDIGVDRDSLKRLEFELFRSKHLSGNTSHKPLISSFLGSVESKWASTSLPEDSLPISTWLTNGVDDTDLLQVCEYAINRKIFDMDNVYWSPSNRHNMNNRITIPYYYKNKLVGYTSRYTLENRDQDTPKYKQHLPSGFVYNLDSQLNYKNKFVILFEGVMDAKLLGGISSLGEITPVQCGIIRRLEKKIIVCPDRDAAGYNLIEAAIENNWDVAFPRWPGDMKDAAEAVKEYGKILTLKSILDETVSGAERINVRWKVEQSARNRLTKRYQK